MKTTIGILALFLLFSTAAAYQNTLNIRQHGQLHYNWDFIQAVTVSGNYAYCATGNTGLRIVNISVPNHPEEVGYFLPPGGTVHDVTVSGGYAYLACGEGGLLIVDVSDPSTPQQTGSHDTPGTAYDVAVAGNYACVADDWAGLRIINISDPAAPVETSYYDVPWGAKCVYASETYAYVGCYDSLAIVGIWNPTTPTLVGSCRLSYYTKRDITVSAGYAYLATDSGLAVVNVSNPYAPFVTALGVTGGMAAAIAISGNYAYVAEMDSGLQKLSLANPAVPTRVGTYSSSWGPRGVAVAPGYVYLGAKGLRVLGAPNPPVLSEVGHYDRTGGITDVARFGNYIYASNASGMAVVDITDPEAPVLTAFRENMGWNRIFLRPGLAYLGQSNGLTVCDLTNPAEPVQAGWVQIPGGAASLAIIGHYAYAAHGSFYMRLVDLTNLNAPTQIVDLSPPAYGIIDVAAQGNFLYVVRGTSGEHDLSIFDASNPLSPVEVGHANLDYGYSEQRVAVQGNYAYVSYAHTFKVFDVSDPANPLQVGWEDLSYTLSGRISVSGRFAYVGEYGISVVDVSNPASPQEVCFFHDSHEDMNAVCEAGNGLLAVGGDYGLYIMEFPLSASASLSHIAPPAENPAKTITLLSASPNPFNATTTLCFDLPAELRARLVVFDLLGREVATVANGSFAAGTHTVSFDGSRLGSGVYYAVLNAGSEVRTTKLLLLK